MKIGINIVGLSHNDLGNGMHTYKDGYENLFKNVINPLKENNDIKIYVYTYNTPETDNILEIYKPIKYTILDSTNSNSAELGANTYIDSLEKLRDEDVDFIITTRFDLNIHCNIDIDFKKFNFLFKELNNWDDSNLTSDTFYAFPKDMLEDVIISLKETWLGKDTHFCPGLFHCLYRFLVKKIGESNIEFIDNEESTIQISNKFRIGKYDK
jgi:hypothetical protein